MTKYPYLVVAEDPLHFRAATVEAEDAVDALEQAVAQVKAWREEARRDGWAFTPRGGIRVIAKSGQFQAARVEKAG